MSTKQLGRRIRRVALVFDDELRPETTGNYVLRALSQLVEVVFFKPSQLAEIQGEGSALPNLILHVDRSQWSSAVDYRATFLNLYLLADCRELVISHWSNFGRIAAFLAGRQAWITRKATDGKLFPIVREPFRRAELTELLSKEELVPEQSHNKEFVLCASNEC